MEVCRVEGVKNDKADTLSRVADADGFKEVVFRVGPKKARSVPVQYAGHGVPGSFADS